MNTTFSELKAGDSFRYPNSTTIWVKMESVNSVEGIRLKPQNAYHHASYPKHGISRFHYDHVEDATVVVEIESTV